MTEKDKFKSLLSEIGITEIEFAEQIGITFDSYKTLMSRKSIPKWVKAVLIVSEKL